MDIRFSDICNNWPRKEENTGPAAKQGHHWRSLGVGLGNGDWHIRPHLYIRYMGNTASGVHWSQVKGRKPESGKPYR